jgi:hypothetical protein
MDHKIPNSQQKEVDQCKCKDSPRKNYNLYIGPSPEPHAIEFGTNPSSLLEGPKRQSHWLITQKWMPSNGSVKPPKRPQTLIPLALCSTFILPSFRPSIFKICPIDLAASLTVNRQPLQQQRPIPYMTGPISTTTNLFPPIPTTSFPIEQQQPISLVRDPSSTASPTSTTNPFPLVLTASFPMKQKQPISPVRLRTYPSGG